nr:hypothetical protein [Clostridia bacterium]
MNKLARTLSAIALSASVLASSAISSSAVFGGGVFCYYTTDIRTTVFGAPITSYNINGLTVIDAEALMNYGVEVVWHADERKLTIDDLGTGLVTDDANSGKLCTSKIENPGQVAGNYYSTDIVTTLNGTPIESYNLGGRTVIVAEEMLKFGYSVVWHPDEKMLTIEQIK